MNNSIRIIRVHLCSSVAKSCFIFLALASCTAPQENPSPEPPGPAPDGMVWVPPGTFWMGSDEFPDAGPVHRVRLAGFWMDRTEVTNEQFAAFVEATKYETVAEHPLDPREFPTLPVRDLVPSSAVFRDAAWKMVPGANWRHPDGPGSNLAGKEKYPVVHVAHPDAIAYAEWANKRLPTEAEWERAARGGLDRQPFYWGDTLKPDGRWQANIWQGKFPRENTAEDGYTGLAPVGSYPANAFGLVDMSGNVWEWCADWYRPGYDVSPGGLRIDPAGPTSSIDTHGRDEPKRVQRGGSFLCSDNECKRYRSGGRMQGEPKTSSVHVGFRCVKSPAR